MRNGEGGLRMAPDRGAAKGVEVEGADPTKTVVPLVAALIPAAAVPPLGVVAIAAAELHGLRGRGTPERGESASENARFGAIGDGEGCQSQRQICENAQNQ